MKKLDLHGVKHEDVERLLENFILLNAPPLKVITGNSDYMRSILEKFCLKQITPSCLLYCLFACLICFS